MDTRGACPPGKVPIPKNRYQEIDWKDLWRRLYGYAVTLVHGTSTVIDCGISAEDLVSETFQTFFDSPNGLGWRESKGTLAVFLGAVLRNKFIDHIRREKKVLRPESDASEPRRTPASGASLEDDLALQELKDRLLSLIKGRVDERELAEFILAASMTTDEGKVNQQLAGLMQVDVGEVISRRKRLLRVAGVKELYEEFGHGRKGNKSTH